MMRRRANEAEGGVDAHMSQSVMPGDKNRDDWFRAEKIVSFHDTPPQGYAAGHVDVEYLLKMTTGLDMEDIASLVKKKMVHERNALGDPLLEIEVDKITFQAQVS